MSSIIMEIRAGTGGQEAALFVADLFKMYSKYAQSQGWKIKTLDSHSTEIGGFKQITFELKAHQKEGEENPLTKMKNEGGVHRVQRIPTTERSGRIHTSTVTVAVLEKPKEVKIQIRPEDLRVDTFRASGAGGQYVNKKETAIRITHLPSGTVATCQTERNQLQNKESALTILKARLFESQKTKGIESLSKKRRTQIGQAKRVEKIRTYNFPQNRITDHRIKKSWHNLEKIMDGKMGSMLKTLAKKL